MKSTAIFTSLLFIGIPVCLSVLVRMFLASLVVCLFYFSHPPLGIKLMNFHQGTSNMVEELIDLSL